MGSYLYPVYDWLGIFWKNSQADKHPSNGQPVYRREKRTDSGCYIHKWIQMQGNYANDWLGENNQSLQNPNPAKHWLIRTEDEETRSV